MTRKQYNEMAEDFAKFAGMYVPYKSMNIYYGRGYGELSRYKYKYETAILKGVGVGANAECFILQREGVSGRIAIHYSNITWPL